MPFENSLVVVALKENKLMVDYFIKEKTTTSIVWYHFYYW
jgi:hypothetical protein